MKDQLSLPVSVAVPARLLRRLSLFLLLGLPTRAQDPAPGSILRRTSGDTSDARFARTVALHVSEGGAVAPFLKAGAFKAQWEGKPVLKKRSRLIFHLEGTGMAKLPID